MTTYPHARTFLPAGEDDRTGPIRLTGATAVGESRTLHRRDRLLLGGLLACTAALYLIGLSRSGWANEFYAAAAQAAGQSWKAWLFGSLDSSNFITVDKPPASLWVMGLSVRIFGVSAWSILLPQALAGVASVALLWAAVRRVAGPTAGLLAGAVLATTPVATLMFRFNNPDALLVLLMTAAGYATVRAIGSDRGRRWLVLAGVLLGFAFLTKMLQGFLVLPGMAAAYLVAGRPRLPRRLLDLLLAGLAMVAAAGWWVALVELWPAGSRPYIGGSTDNSVLELVFGYNGFGRLTGGDNNGTPGAGGGGGFSSGQTGLTRLFGSEMGSQISWLLPAALLSLAVLVVLTWRRHRTDPLRGSVIVWGGWLVVTGVVFSFANGIIHPYYTVALAPAIAALVGTAVAVLFGRRAELSARGMLALIVAAGTVWSFVLLGRADWHPELRWVLAASGAAAVAVVLLGRRVPAVLAGPVLAVALLLAPTAYSIQTASTAHTGALPTAGPSSAGFGGPGGAGRPGGAGGSPPGGFTGAPGGASGSQAGGAPGFGPGGGAGVPGGSGTGDGAGVPGGTAGGNGNGNPGGNGTGNAGGNGRGGGLGGLGGATQVDSALVEALQSGDYRWAAATINSNQAASLELASGRAVMALGGFNGTDPAITLESFQHLVATKQVHYFIAGGAQGFIGSTQASTSTAYQIQQWVEQTFTATTIGGTTVYDLTG